jgi:hypothetical protein
VATIELATGRRLLRAAGCGCALSGLLGLPLAALAQAPQLSPEQAEAALAERLGVEVLGSETIETDAGTRYAIKVMNPPGNSNDAFLVTTLLVDAASGEILGEAQTSWPPSATGDFPNGIEMRRRSFR